MATAFIGDVHGWADRLERLLAQIDPADRIVFVGDLIDRGPAAPAVLDRVRALCASGRAACIMGNHEYALVRGLGVEALGIPGDEPLYRAWIERYGGHAVLEAYGVGDGDRDALTKALGDHLGWLARLPWLLEGDDDGRRWIAVHAGLGTKPLAPQLADLAGGPRRMREPTIEQHPALYAKPRAFLLPCDLPDDVCIVSGHTPLPRAHLTPRRILCDTSGGLPERALTAVVFGSGRIVAS